MSPKIFDKKAVRGDRVRPGAKKNTPVSGEDPRISRLEKLVRILESSSLAELDYEDEEIAVGLKRHSVMSAGTSSSMQMQASPSPPPPPAQTSSSAHAAPSASTAAQAAPVEDKSITIVRSPFVGTFYSSPSPEAQPFAEVGARVRRGQTLCIIEAMKLMNEIEAEVDGVVLETMAENGKAVQYGDALFKIQTS